MQKLFYYGDKSKQINTSSLALLCSLAITIIFPIIIAIFSATIYGVLGGIAYSIVFIIVYFLIYGQASVNLNRTFDVLMILSAIVIFISVSMTFELAIPFYMSLVACWLIYLYVYYIGKTIINKYALKSFDMFTFLASTNIVHVQDRNGNVIV